MRIWDINPGYLNRQSLLGEHRELHGLLNIITEGKKGYSRHPETLRWVPYRAALAFRHRLLSAEMSLRGYRDLSPVPIFPPSESPEDWPSSFIDVPADQFRILGEKYRDKTLGRIPLPINAQQLWSQHKYSILARNNEFYREVGPRLSNDISSGAFRSLSGELIDLMRFRPTSGGIRNALLHMWGFVRNVTVTPDNSKIPESAEELIKEIRIRAVHIDQPYLMASTALNDLAVWTGISS